MVVASQQPLDSNYLDPKEYHWCPAKVWLGSMSRGHSTVPVGDIVQNQMVRVRLIAERVPWPE